MATNSTHKDLVNAAHRWVLKNASCGVAFKELVAAGSNEIPDVIGFGSSKHSVVVECKVSRNDFLCDKNKPFRKNPAEGMGRRRYYCCPTGLIKREELPEGWGLVYVNERGKATCVHRPIIECQNPEHPDFTSYKWQEHECNERAERDLMYSVLRRLEVKGVLKHCYLPQGVSPEETDAQSVVT